MWPEFGALILQVYASRLWCSFSPLESIGVEVRLPCTHRIYSLVYPCTPRKDRALALLSGTFYTHSTSFRGGKLSCEYFR